MLLFDSLEHFLEISCFISIVHGQGYYWYSFYLNFLGYYGI